MRPFTLTLTLAVAIVVSGCTSTQQSLRSFFEVDPARSDRQVPEGTFQATAPAPALTADQVDPTAPPPPMDTVVDLSTAPEKRHGESMEVTQRMVSTPAPLQTSDDSFFPFQSSKRVAAAAPANPVVAVTEEGQILRRSDAAPAKVAAPAPAPAPKVVPVAAATRKPAAAVTPPAMSMVYFDKGSSALNRMNRELVKENVAWLLANPNFAVLVEGHTDAGGSEEHNEKVGAERAKLVADYMIHLGLDSSRIETVSYGETRPIDDSGTRAAQAKNRRVQFLVYQIAVDAASALTGEADTTSSTAQVVFGQ